MKPSLKEYKPKYDLSKRTEIELLINFVEQDEGEDSWKNLCHILGVFTWHQAIKKEIYSFAIRNKLK